uniref:MADF domain-containing protein n=1 Tax=Timema douglasi TaxID=61478 RepID=A0A7R8VV81_TIMDO|nr:unnamed protein product [Timema douglasi]
MAKLKVNSDEKLIELVKMHPALYDRGQEDYKDAQMKEIIWKTIGESVGKTVGECKKRWKDIRDNYFRNKRKELASTRLSKWRLYKLLTFLDQARREKRSQCSLPEDSEGETSQQSEYLLNVQNTEDSMDIIMSPSQLKSEDPTASCIDSLQAESGRSQDTHASQPSVKSHSLNKAASYYKVVEGIKKNRITERMRILRSMAREEDDDVDLFFKSVAITVKRFPPHLIGTAKLKVLTVINELQQSTSFQCTS